MCQLSVRTKPFSHNLTPNLKCSANLCHFNVFLFYQRWSLSGGFVTGSLLWLKSLHTSSSGNMTDGTPRQPAQWRTIRYDDTARTGGIRLSKQCLATQKEYTSFHSALCSCKLHALSGRVGTLNGVSMLIWVKPHTHTHTLTCSLCCAVKITLLMMWKGKINPWVRTH